MAVTPSTDSQNDKYSFLQQQLTLLILLADRVHNSALEAESTRSECLQLANQIDRLSPLFRSSVRFTSSFYDRPIRRIFADVTKTLERALILVRKCKHSGIIQRVFLTVTSSITDFNKVSNLLESSVGDLQWMTSLYGSETGVADVGIPPIARSDPILAWIWISIASLYKRPSCNNRVDSANSLASYARENHVFRKAIVEEGGIPPLLNLLKAGEGSSTEEKIAASTALFCLSDNKERIAAIVDQLGIGVIVNALAKSSVRVQVAVAKLVAKMAEIDPTVRKEFGKSNIFKLLINSLIIDLNMDDYNQTRVKNTSIQSKDNKVEWSSSLNENEDENERSEIKHKLKINCALAMWRLCDGNVYNSRKVSEPKGLCALAKMIESENGELKLNCLMTVMEIAKVAESNVEIRKLVWKPNSPPAKQVLGQILTVVRDEKDSEFLIPVIKTIGCLARIFSGRETGVISSLVVHLGNTNVIVGTEAAITLAKFVSPDNHNCVAHSKTIIEFNGVAPLMKLLSSCGRPRMNGLVLLSYLSIHVGNAKVLAEARALKTLEDVVHSGIAQNHELREVFHRAMNHLRLYDNADHHIVVL